MKITIAIPTHNRAPTLRQTLASIGALELDGIDAECLVVDNRSTDQTPELVDRLADSMPTPTRRICEARPGSSYARNRAFDEAAGDYILFLDDDAVADRRWAIEILAEMERRRLDCACGMVLPQWSEPPPQWLAPPLYARLAVHDPATSGDPSWERMANYFSANVAFRRDVPARFGRFREDLGVVGGNPISGEDTELLARIESRGGRVGFAPCAVVHHLIGPERLTRAYFRRKAFAYGVGSAVAGGRHHNRVDKMLKNAWRMLAARARRDATGVLYHELECINFLGFWRGRLRPRGNASD
jgi:glycosyltransferase involved in cell wall biosynthesis